MVKFRCNASTIIDLIHIDKYRASCWHNSDESVESLGQEIKLWLSYLKRGIRFLTSYLTFKYDIS